MPRNASGTYTLPAGNPVVSGTVIESSWANTTMDDLAVAMTDSLSRSGNGGMLAALLATNGTVANPGISFVTDQTTGMYLISSGNLGFTANATNVLTLSATAITPALPTRNVDGSAAAPSYSFASDTDTGMYLVTPGELGMSADGTVIMNIASTRIDVSQAIREANGSAAIPSYSFSADTDTGMYLPGPSILGFSVDSTVIISLTSALANYFVPIEQIDGSVSDPSYTFASESNTGMYLGAPNQISFAVAGNEEFVVSNALIRANRQLRAITGSAGSPSYSFESDPITGFYSSGGGTMSLTLAGTSNVGWNIGSNLFTCLLLMREADGNVTNPAYSFASDPDTGTYLASAGDYRITVGGVDQVQFANNAAAVYDNLDLAFYRIISTKDVDRNNAVMNGKFRLWQRGTSFTGGAFTADRWLTSQTDTNDGLVTREAFTLGQTDVPSEPEYYIRLTPTVTQGAGSFLQQSIEDVRTFAGEQVTLSFYIRSSIAQTATVIIRQFFGAGGGSANVDIINNVTATTGWTRQEFAVTMGGLSGATIGSINNDSVRIIFVTNVNLTVHNFDIANVQYERGQSASTIQERPIAEELQLCQRYFEKSYNVDVDPATVTAAGRELEIETRNSATVSKGINFTVTKRSTPEVRIYSDVTGAFSNVANGIDRASTNGTVSTKGMDLITIAAGTTASPASYQWTANADL